MGEEGEEPGVVGEAEGERVGKAVETWTPPKGCGCVVKACPSVSERSSGESTWLPGLLPLFLFSGGSRRCSAPLSDLVLYLFRLTDIHTSGVTVASCSVACLFRHVPGASLFACVIFHCTNGGYNLLNQSTDI